MKLSDKIIIGFFGFIFLYMIAAFTELRFKGENTSFDTATALIETLPISNIRYLRISDFGRNIVISSSTNPRIEVRSKTGELLQELEYEILEDTINITGFRIENTPRYNIHVFVPLTGFAGIEIQNSVVTISDLTMPRISIKQIKGNITLYDKIHVGKLIIDSEENSTCSISNVHIDTLSARLNSSNLFIYSQIPRMEGSLENSSRLLHYGPGEIEFTKDGTSLINWIESENH